MFCSLNCLWEFELYISRAEAIPMGKNNVRLQMKLIHSNFASLLLILLRWIDLSCSCFVPRYLNLFHVLVYKVSSCPCDVKVSSFIRDFDFLTKSSNFCCHLCLVQVHSDGQPKLTTHGRKATISEFYGVILPSLQLLHSNLDELETGDIGFDLKRLSKKITKEARSGSSRFTNAGLEREEECGICLETCTKMVLPNCCHSMCIKCYRNW